MGILKRIKKTISVDPNQVAGYMFEGDAYCSLNCLRLMTSNLEIEEVESSTITHLNAYTKGYTCVCCDESLVSGKEARSLKGDFYSASAEAHTSKNLPPGTDIEHKEALGELTVGALKRIGYPVR